MLNSWGDWCGPFLCRATRSPSTTAISRHDVKRRLSFLSLRICARSLLVSASSLSQRSLYRLGKLVDIHCEDMANKPPSLLVDLLSCGADVSLVTDLFIS